MKKFEGDSWHVVFQFPNVEANSNSPRAIWSSRKRRGESYGKKQEPTWRLILFDVFLFCFFPTRILHILFWLDSWCQLSRIMWERWKTWNLCFCCKLKSAPVCFWFLCGWIRWFCLLFPKAWKKGSFANQRIYIQSIFVCKCHFCDVLPRWCSPDCEDKVVHNCTYSHALYRNKYYISYNTWIILIIFSFIWHICHKIFSTIQDMLIFYVIQLYITYFVLYTVYIYIYTFLYIEDFYFRYDNALLCYFVL